MANQRTSCNGVRCVCVCVFLRFKWQTQKMGWCHLDCSFSYSSLLFRWDVWGMGFFSWFPCIFLSKPSNRRRVCLCLCLVYTWIFWFNVIFFFSFFPLWKSHNLSVCDVWLCTLISIIPWCTVCFLRWSFRKLFKYYICLWTWQFTTFLSLFISPLCDMCVRARVCIPNVLIEYLYFVNTVLS